MASSTAQAQILNNSTDHDATVAPEAGSSDHREPDTSLSDQLDGGDVQAQDSAPDFVIYSIPDYPEHFHVRRQALINGSETFDDMFVSGFYF